MRPEASRGEARVAWTGADAGGAQARLRPNIHSSRLELKSIMDPERPPVKTRRKYDASRRRAEARERRHAVLEAARSRFLRDGFASTTVAAIAADVGVSVDTIYKAFGGKAGLLRALYDRMLEGEEPVAAETRSDLLQRSETDSHKVFQGLGAFTAEVAPRAAPIYLLIDDAAATDPSMAALVAQLDAARLTRMLSVAGALHKAGHLRPDVSAEDAADVMWTCTAPRLFDLLVNRRGWSAQRFGDFIADVLDASLGSRGGAEAA